MEKIYTPHQVAEALHIRPTTVYWLLHTKQMRAYRMATRWKIPESSVEAWMQEQLKGELNG